MTRHSYSALRGTLAALGAAAASLAYAADPGVTDSVIRIGVSAPLTGPVAAVGAVSEGIKVRVAAANAAGGVKMGDGKTRTIELVVQDDGIDPQRTLTNVRKMVEQGEVFALVGIAGTPNNQAIGKYVEQKKVPNLFMYSGVQELAEGPNWMIGLVPSFTTEAAAFAEHLKASRPDAKVAVLFLNTETGLTFKSALTGALKGSRVRVLAEQAVTPVDPTIDTQMSNLKASGADTLVIIAPPRQGAQAVKFAAESGWKPVTLLSYIASSVAALRPAGLDNAKGLITSQFIKPVDALAFAEDAAVKRFLADHAAAKPRFDKTDSQGQVGYVTGEALIRVLELMKQPTRQAMMDAARQMNKAEVGLLLPGITLTTRGAADPYPIESLQLVRFDGAQYVPLGKPVSFEGKTPRHN
jgi:ABC-type branched-subunit amino acid transport system substrate-binding protein